MTHQSGQSNLSRVARFKNCLNLHQTPIPVASVSNRIGDRSHSKKSVWQDSLKAYRLRIPVWLDKNLTKSLQEHCKRLVIAKAKGHSIKGGFIPHTRWFWQPRCFLFCWQLARRSFAWQEKTKNISYWSLAGHNNVQAQTRAPCTCRTEVILGGSFLIQPPVETQTLNVFT